ncbi:zeta toxin family protein [Streptomyces griseobrunneus]|uniref:zeta toxin family protein n=1 Tax=Streptomyces microflavus TaxID=1919 RepID=UPI003800886B
MKQAQQFVRGEDLSGGRKLNALVQETAMDPQFLAETMRSYRDVGTRIDTFVLAVSQALSEQGVLNRYHEQVLDRGQGRLTVPEKALASYTGIADSCEVIVREGLSDFAAVYRRGESTPRFAADAVELSRNRMALRQSVERERNRPWAPEESQDFLGVQRKLREGLPADFGPQLDRIDQLAAPLLARVGPGTPRISSAAARSRSTTTPSCPPVPGKGPAPTDQAAPRGGAEGPGQRRGRSK